MGCEKILKLTVVLFLGLISGKLQQVTSSKSYPITTLINAKWEQTPVHLEIAEYLADENPNLYWDYVKDASELDTPLSSYDTQSQSYNAALKLVRKGLTDIQIPLMKLVVSMHSLTPRIQTHFQIASEVVNKSSCMDSTTFAQIGSELVCSFDELRQKLASSKQGKALDATIETYAFDHIFPGSENNTRTVVLYGDFGTSSFAQYHYLLSAKALSGTVRYVTRHYLSPKTRDERKRVRLSGYGVELHLKSTEYKSQDDAPKPAEGSTEADLSAGADMEIQGFDFSVLKERFPTMVHSLDKLRQSLLQGNDEIAQLKAWEFQDLGLQAAQAIAEIDGEEALKILQYTAHNFPMQARALLGHKVSDQLRSEVKHNTEVFGRNLNIVPPDGALFVNGLFFDADSMDLNSLIETLRTEVRVLESLHKSQVRGGLASALLALDFSGSGSKEFAIDIRDSAITWINDIEQDVQYRRWPSSVMDLLRPTFPGMLRNIRKNVFNLVLIVDPLQPTSRSLIKLAESFVLHLAPVRLGLVFDARQASDDNQIDYLSISCAFNYVMQKKDARSALSFLTDIFADVDAKQAVTRKHIKSQLKKSFDRLSSSAVDDILDEDSDFDYGRQLALEFVERLGFSDSPQALLNGVPMQSNILLSDSDFEETIFSEIIQQTTTLQKAVYRGDLTDSEEILDYLMNQPHVMPRLNQRILGNNENAKFLDLTGSPHNDLSNVNALALLSNRDMTATLLKNIKYFEGKHSFETIGDQKLHFLTLWIFADLEKESGKELLKNALQYVRAGASVRIAFIPNVEGSDVGRKDNLNRLVWAAQQTLGPKEATELVQKWLKQTSDKWDIPEAVSEIISSTELHMKILRVYAQRVLNLKAAERLVIGNGKIIGPILDTELFGIEDFGLIDRFNAIQYADKLRKALNQNSHELEPNFNSDTLLKLYTSLLSRQTKTRFKLPDDVKDAHSVVKLPSNRNDLPSFDISAIVDPASRSAQKLAPILILLRQTINCNMKIFLTPVGQHSDMPVKNFYRYVVEPEVQFTPSGELAEGPFAKFTGVPANSLLTQNLQVPENWLVEVVRSVYDLDNIKLSDINGPVHSEFELEYLLLEGHCFDSTTGAPPRGLQVTLGTLEDPVLVDTIVMANLGYFQLKANPGVWTLRLREGKSADIYDITYAEGPNTVHKNGNTQVVISSLKSHVIKMRVTKKPGMANADLLEDGSGQQQSGIWNSIASSFGGGSTTDDEDKDTINIFSVASGHLYERLLRIMMVSAMKHTKSPVKFWFLKNYLSPQFTDFLPHMAKEYGFQYELVQYKWPRWLHQQTEKQRTIWGYKILFLDVLFPLSVRKIIFVDADAIVRADLKDLYDMDLGGAPYAYTPFCDSRKEMEGFRFWKQGYWKSHLMGRRYHISALYVVDLRRFRRIAAGDRLRGQYQALSQDPNSLSNLDQDLPNNMIHQVAIKSLPDEWLWCQTWCSDSAFKNAKVIDLCNNPMTKEAKLTAAQRIVPEWKDYDSEVKSLMARIEDHENFEQHDDTGGGNINENPTSKEFVKHSEL
ncbi:UDP-glucose:glycoprotein glucosyltransferase [Stomoxys calcitrans]|uniref:UDP-glucose:glycoprotein glucosyltransferase n=1 Tax=Stomoxys calcitrans TaxID=35570 RepID=A0A1I8PAU5_STOCA|nr:UDP-glucose:glycoprotein glucosyltransferase [Stomoxys calcitrans]XP_013111448.1 UDP-glucose:glycoprotein glucosyltransferase [Stomoxys calcitrans]